MENKYIDHGKIGGSSIAAILNLPGAWSKPIDVWMRLTGRMAEPGGNAVAEINEAMEWGNRLESAIADAYSEKTGNKLIALPHPGHVFNPKYPFAAATPDRLFADKRKGLEIKNVGLSKARLWADGRIPEIYVVQAQYYMTICEIMGWDMAALIGGNSLRIQNLEYSDSLADALINEAGEFWCNYVLKDTPPPVDDSVNYERAVKRLFPGGSEKTYSIAGDVDNRAAFGLLEAMREAQELESEMQRYRNQLMVSIANDYGIEGVTPDGQPWKATFFPVKGRARTDWAKIAEVRKIPKSVIAKYTKGGEPSRAFKFTPTGEKE